MNLKSLKFGFAMAAVALASMAGSISQAVADEADEWRVAAISGSPYVSNSGVVPVSLGNGEPTDQGEVMQIGDILRPGMWIVTPNDSRALLVRGNETIIVAPSSRMGLPMVAQDGLSTTILHSLGSILLSVDRKADPHFQVITPFLTAVVKGTTFTTTVEERRSKVHVFEGAVHVSNGSNTVENADLAVMFIDDDPDAGFDPFALHGPAIADPIEIRDSARILPMGSDLFIESGQTAGVALDNDGRDRVNRRSIGRSDNPENQGFDSSVDNNDRGNGTIPLNRSLGEDQDRGRSIDNGSNNAPTFMAGINVGGGTARSSILPGSTIRRPGKPGTGASSLIQEDQGGGGHGGRGF